MKSQSNPTFEKCLLPGSFIYWRNRRYRVVARDESSSLIVHVEDVETAEPDTLSVAELLCSPDDKSVPLFAPTLKELEKEIEGQCPALKPISPLSLPDNLLQKADTIIAVVDAVEKWVSEKKRLASLRHEKFKQAKMLEEACGQLDQLCSQSDFPIKPIGLTTYYKYQKSYRKYSGDRVQIAASLRRSDFNQSRMDEAQLHFIDTIVMRYFARKNRPRPATVYGIAGELLKRTGGKWIDLHRCRGEVPQDLVNELLKLSLPMGQILENPEKVCLLKPIELPSSSWFYDYLRWFAAQPDDGKAVMTERYGKEAWESEYMAFDVFVNRASLPLQYVFADHWWVDVFTVDEETRSNIFRLWLTALIDAFSRSIIGIALLYEHPCIESIQSALLHAIWPKTSHLELGIEGEWAPYGYPLQLSLDNAWAHHSGSLENLTRRISRNGRYNSIDLDFRPPYKGHYGSLIERFFGNLSDKVKQLLSSAIQSSNPKDVRNATKFACLLYQDVNKVIHSLIVDYQHTPHHELGGMTPHEKWEEGMGGGNPLVPPLTDEMERLFWRMDPGTRVITSRGVCAFGMHYWGAGLGRVPKKRGNNQIEYDFHYSTSDISTLAIFKDGDWVMDVKAHELRLPDGSYRPVSLWERKAAMALARKNRQPVSRWLKYLDEFSELEKQRLAEKKKTQQASHNKSHSGHASVASAQAIEEAMQDMTKVKTDQDPTKLLAGFMGDKST